METFAPTRPLVADPQYSSDRQRVLASFDPGEIDPPIRELVAGLLRLPQCFTLQSCYGHFVHAEQPDRFNVEALPSRDVGQVTYRIAYLALCIENSRAGQSLLRALEGIPTLDPEYVQLGSPTWFWNRHRNSYALQVEPERFLDRDVAVLDHDEALRVEEVRGRFFTALHEIVRAALSIAGRE
jgi:hypothetical protein